MHSIVHWLSKSTHWKSAGSLNFDDLNRATQFLEKKGVVAREKYDRFHFCKKSVANTHHFLFLFVDTRRSKKPTMVNSLILNLSECANREPRTEQDIVDMYTLMKLHEEGGEEADQTFFPMMDPTAHLAGGNSPTATEDEMNAIRNSPEAMVLVLGYYARFLGQFRLRMLCLHTGVLDVDQLTECENAHEAEIQRTNEVVGSMKMQKERIYRVVSSLMQLGLTRHANNLVAYMLRQFATQVMPPVGYFPNLAVCPPAIRATREAEPYATRPGGMMNTLCTLLKSCDSTRTHELTESLPVCEGASYEMCEKCFYPVIQFAYIPKGVNRATTTPDKLPELCKMMLMCGLSFAKVLPCNWNKDVVLSKTV